MRICTFISSGVSLYYAGIGHIKNNSILQLPLSGSSTHLQCISASLSAGVGKFIAPNGDIINGTAVTIGGASDPGNIALNLQSMLIGTQGVYKCIIPDENGMEQILHVGIYYGSFKGML